jgi:FkbM family methyltransferase
MKLIDDFFGKQRGLVFVDIGSYLSGQDTLFLERERDWKGLCVEAHPEHFEHLTNNRKCACENIAIGDFEGLSLLTDAGVRSGLKCFQSESQRRVISEEFGVVCDIIVEVIPLQILLRRYHIEKIDLLVIDTNGSEMSVLRSIDFYTNQIRMICIRGVTEEIDEFLKKQGFMRRCVYSDCVIFLCPQGLPTSKSDVSLDDSSFV